MLTKEPIPEPASEVCLKDQLVDEEDVLPLWPTDDVFEERMLPFTVPRRHKKPKRPLKKEAFVQNVPDDAIDDENIKFTEYELDDTISLHSERRQSQVHSKRRP